jgi:hypothetical protein
MSIRIKARSSSKRYSASARFGDGVDRLVLTHDALMQLVFEVQQFLFLAFQQLGNRNSSPARDHSGDVVFIHLFFGKPRPVFMGQPLFLGR